MTGYEMKETSEHFTAAINAAVARIMVAVDEYTECMVEHQVGVVTGEYLVTQRARMRDIAIAEDSLRFLIRRELAAEAAARG